MTEAELIFTALAEFVHAPDRGEHHAGGGIAKRARLHGSATKTRLMMI
jgi:hypothetical protein